MKRIIPAIFSVSFIIASLVLSVNGVGYKAIPDAYANTNAVALATIASNDTKVSSATTSTEGLQIKKSLTLIMSLDI